MSHRHVRPVAIMMYSVIAVFAILLVVQFGTSLNPVGFARQSVQSLFGVSIGYNLQSNVFPFFYSKLDIVNSVTAKCTLSSTLTGTTDQGQSILLSSGSFPDAIPTATLKSNNLLGTSRGVGNSFASFTVTSLASCTSNSLTYYPNLVGGTTSLYWTATNKAGNQVNIIVDKQNINVAPLPQNINGKTVTLYTWTVSKSQIENAIGANPLGDNFVSTNYVSITDNLNFYQGDVKAQLWQITNTSPASMGFQINEVINPIGAGLTQTSQGVNLVLLSPTDGKLNIQGLLNVRLDGQLPNWNTAQGNPELKLFFTDPVSTSPTNALLDKFPPAGSTDSQGITHFPVTYLFSPTVQPGQYTFKFYQNGRVATGTQIVQVTSSSITCASGQYYDNANQACKNIIPDPQCTSTQTLIAGQCVDVKNSSDTCTPSQLQSGYSVQTINGQQVCAPIIALPPWLQAYASMITPTIGLIGFVLILLIAGLYHYSETKAGRPGLSPSAIYNIEQ